MDDYASVLTLRKIRSVRREFHVLNDSGNVLYFVRQKKFSYGRTLLVFDPEGNQVGVIRQCFALILPKYQIRIGQNEAYIIRRKFSLTIGYTISELPWVFEGNFTGSHICVSDAGNHPLFVMSRISHSLTDKYHITLYDAKQLLLSICITFALDSVEQDLHRTAKS